MVIKHDSLDSNDVLLPVIDNGEVHTIDLDKAISVQDNTLTAHNDSGKLVLDFSWDKLQSDAQDIKMIDLTQDGDDISTSQVLVLDSEAVEKISLDGELFIKADRPQQHR